MSRNDPVFITPQWPAPARVRALSTTRLGGVSVGPYAAFNLGMHVGDDPECVAHNREILQQQLPANPLWLNQVHGTHAVNVADVAMGVDADAAVAQASGQVCCIMTADCLPVLLCDTAGSVVGAAHAGWRGLCGGVLETTIEAMQVQGEHLLAWMGPAIGPPAFEVGDEVRAAFVAHSSQAAEAFRAADQAGKWYADIYLLARQRLVACGVQQIYGGDEHCTFSDEARFFSYRRDGKTGRMASLIWLE